MWVVKDQDTTIYLVGTFHALDGKRDWFNDEVRAAFDASHDVVLEVLTPENPAELGPMVLKYALDTTGKTLTSNQIEFVNLVVDHLTEKGAMDARLLYESPYTDFSPMGVDGLFSPSDATELFSILEEIRRRAAA